MVAQAYVPSLSLVPLFSLEKANSVQNGRRDNTLGRAALTKRGEQEECEPVFFFHALWL
jgi:hypothetical protein